jgi:hypothetical protein
MAGFPRRRPEPPEPSAALRPFTAVTRAPGQHSQALRPVLRATLPDVYDEPMRRVAQLLRERNAIDKEIAAITHRPMTSGHLGEWITAQIFDIQLEQSAVAAGIDGIFRSGPLQGCTVNIKWYLKREGLLDTSESARLDYYLVLTGPPSAAASSRGATRPWRIDAVFLFDTRQLRAEQIERGVKRGTASSVVKRQWAAAEVYPGANPMLPISSRQAELLQLFGAD